MNLIGFSEFYNDSEKKWVEMLSIIFGLRDSERTLCEFVAKTGLVNIELFRFRPSLKAFAAITIYMTNARIKLSEYDMIKDVLKISDVELESALKHLKIALQYDNVTSNRSSLFSQYGKNNKKKDSQ